MKRHRCGSVVRAARRAAVALVPLLLAIWVVGCGAPAATPFVSGSIASPAPTAPAAASIVGPTASVAPSPTSAPAATAGRDTFRSTVYPYQLTLPAGVLKTPWVAAREAWNGTGRIDHGDRHTDYASVADGDLFVFGTPWPGTLDEFYQREQQNAVDDHSCTDPPLAVVETAVAGSDAVLHTQECQGAFVVKVAVVRQAFGLVITELVWGNDRQGAIDRLMESLAGLKWLDG